MPGSRYDDMELPSIPKSSHTPGEIRSDQFSRKNLKSILHCLTGELKRRGTKTPHIFLPFRSKIDDFKLEKFLMVLFPHGEIIKSEDKIYEVLLGVDEFTLICCLKYLWSRLPNNEIIGWDVYLEYKRKEKEAGYPKSAFLSIMPKCLSSPAHASIVYDFLDLLISISSNSQYNFLSGRKIAKMSSIWAFNNNRYIKNQKSAFYDATLLTENTFIDGLNDWKESTDAIFHLLLSFLRAMLPDNEMETLKLPKTLQSLLITNSYPPLANTDSIKSIITIPCVSVRSTKISASPYELISKVRHALSFEKKDAFVSIENYTILKNIFEKNTTNEIVSSLTEESRRVLNRLTEPPINSRFDLYPGWLRQLESSASVDPNIPLYSEITISNVSIQDYYIWTWLSSLGSDQPKEKKSLFGRSLVVEAGLRGFQKWMIITEVLMTTDDYLNKFKSSNNLSAVPRVPQKDDKRSLSGGSYKDMPLPPPPPPSKNDSDLLPSISFEDDEKLSIEVGGGIIDAHTYDYENQDNEMNDYTRYLSSLNISDDNITPSMYKKVEVLEPIVETRRQNYRPPPPQFDPPSTQNQTPYQQNNTFASNPLLPESTNSNVYEYQHLGEYVEPYTNYETEEERAARELSVKAQDPYSEYYIPGVEAQQAQQPTQVHEPFAYQDPNGQQPAEQLIVQSEDPSSYPQGDQQQYEQSPEAAPAGETIINDENKENMEVKKKKKKKKSDKEKKKSPQLPFPFPVPPGMIPPFMDSNGKMENMPPMGFFPLPPGMEPPKKTKDKKKKKKKSPSSSPKQTEVPKFEITPVSNEQSPNLNDAPVLQPATQQAGTPSSPRSVQSVNPAVQAVPAPAVQSQVAHHQGVPPQGVSSQVAPSPSHNVPHQAAPSNTAPHQAHPTSIPSQGQAPTQQYRPLVNSQPSHIGAKQNYPSRTPSPVRANDSNQPTPNNPFPHSPIDRQQMPSLPPTPIEKSNPTSPMAPQGSFPNRSPQREHQQLNQVPPYGHGQQARLASPVPPVQHQPPEKKQPPIGVHQGHPSAPGQGQPSPRPVGQTYPPQARPGQHPSQVPPTQAHPPAQGHPVAQGHPPTQARPPAQGYPPAQSYPPAQGYPAAGKTPPVAPGHAAPAAAPQPYGYPPQGYYPPPQGYYPPPQGYYPPPQGYYPPPQGYPYYPPPGGAAAPPPAATPEEKKSRSDVAIMGMPTAGKHNKNKQANKANLRNAFIQGSFGI